MLQAEWAEQDLMAAAAENLVLHMTWVHGRVPGMLAVVDRALAMADAGLATDTFNTICRARLGPADQHRISEAVRHFRERSLPFSWWVGPGDSPADLDRMLTDQGLVFAESEVAMAAPLSGLGGSTIPDGLRIERVTTPRALREFAEISAGNWSPPDQGVLTFYDMASAVLLSRKSPLWFYVGRVDAGAVAAAEVAVTGRVAGLYNVSTVAGFRRRGIGLAMTIQPLLEAKAAGAELGILQASTAGAGVYERAGFSAFGEYREFKPAW